MAKIQLAGVDALTEAGGVVSLPVGVTGGSGLDAIPVVHQTTTKGDLEVYTTQQTRLAVGTNDQILTANSSAAAGFSWETAAGGGFIKSIATDTETTQLYMNGNAGSYHAVNLELTVTPASAASKFLIFVQLNAKASASAGSSIVNVRLLRDGSQISNAQGSKYVQSGGVYFFGYVPFYMGVPDAPATTSAVTYKVEGKAEDGTVIWNISGIHSHLIVMEY
jgi:hypothetical protein